VFVYISGGRGVHVSDVNFEVFLPAGATRCTDGVKFGMAKVISSMPNFTLPPGATTKV